MHRLPLDGDGRLGANFLAVIHHLQVHQRQGLGFEGRVYGTHLLAAIHPLRVHQREGSGFEGGNSGAHLLALTRVRIRAHPCSQYSITFKYAVVLIKCLHSLCQFSDFIFINSDGHLGAKHPRSNPP